MVIYDLICDAGHQFEGWFKGSDDLETQQQKGLLRCPVCDSVYVTKKLTAPKIARKSNASRKQSDPITPANRHEIIHSKESSKAYKELQGMLTKVHEFVEQNFKDVGNRFADEAISMHKGEKDLSPIRGTATAKEIKDMAEEGVQALPIPPKPIEKKKLN